RVEVPGIPVKNGQVSAHDRDCGRLKEHVAKPFFRKFIGQRRFAKSYIASIHHGCFMVSSSALVAHECSCRGYDVVGDINRVAFCADVHHADADHTFLPAYRTFVGDSILTHQTGSHVIDISTFLDIDQCSDGDSFEGNGIVDAAEPIGHDVSDHVLARKCCRVPVLEYDLSIRGTCKLHSVDRAVRFADTRFQ